MPRLPIFLRLISSNLLLVCLVFLGSGCAFPIRWSVACQDEGWPVLPGQKVEKGGEKPPGPPASALPILGSVGQCYRYRIREKTPQTLLEWQLFKEEEKEGEEEKEDAEKQEGEKKEGGEKKNNGHEKTNGNGTGDHDKNKKNGKSGGDWEIEYEEPLQSDRPDFGAATTNVGRGRVMLETGYSYLYDRNAGERFIGHSYPEALLHVGLFADWFEFRIGQNHANFRTTPVGGSLGGIGAIEPTAQDGFQDLYLGVRLALTEQKKWLPESVVIIQSTVPTGARELTAGQMLPGAIYLFSWEFGERDTPRGVIKPWSIGGLIEADRAIDDSDHFYVQVAQALNLKYQWTRRFSTFVEWVGLYPAGANDPGVGPQHYIHPGVLLLISNNIQLDFHVFIGLNEHAINFFGGPGLCFRY